MTKSVVEPKGHWALDTDWITAALTGFFFLFCFIALAGMSWKVLTGAPVTIHITRTTWFLLTVCMWLTVRAVRAQARITGFAFGLLSVSFASRIILAALHVSIETQAVNAEVMRVVDLLIMAGFCIYVVLDFKRLLKRIPHINAAEKTRQAL